MSHASTARAPVPGSPPRTDRSASHAPLAAVYRGPVLECLHVGAVAVVDRDGNLLYAAGDASQLITTRSALKPFQAMAFVAEGGIARFGYSRPQTALLCASHSGEPRHVDAVSDMLERAGNAPADLQCGSHAPMFYDATGEVPPPPPYSPLAHNCSGKHAGMLAFCTLCGARKGDYLDPEHVVQRAIRRGVAHALGTPEAELVRCIDGCSAPNYAVPLSRLALGFARLASDEDDPTYGNALRVLAAAMTAHPEMVSGEGRNDLAYMQAGRGDWVAKTGAEGVQGIGIRSKGLGIAIKVADGAKRALHPATVAVLDQLGLVDGEQRRALADWREPLVKNYRGIVTGQVRPVVELQRIRDSISGRAPSSSGDER